MQVRGKLSCLLINDIDAGLGHFENTQVTVNNQMVVGRPSAALLTSCDCAELIQGGKSFHTGWNA